MLSWAEVPGIVVTARHRRGWITVDDTLFAGREAVERNAWEEAREAFSAADDERALTPGDLLLFADASWWAGYPDEAGWPTSPCDAWPSPWPPGGWRRPSTCSKTSRSREYMLGCSFCD